VERRGGGDDVHLHAGGQGVWVSGMAGEVERAVVHPGEDVAVQTDHGVSISPHAESQLLRMAPAARGRTMPRMT
jgi:hypothetical protein